MPDPCLVLVAAVCLSRQAHVEMVSNALWGGARLEFGEVTITSVVRSDSGVFPDRRFMPKYCLDETCMYYHVHCSTEGSNYFCRVSYNEPGDIFSRQLEITAPDSARMSRVFGQIRIKGFRSGRLFPVANFRDMSPNPYPPYCRVGTDRGCGTGSDDIVAVVSSPPRDSVGRARHSRCNVGNLDLVFSDPIRYRGQRFCGEVVGVPDRTGILFYPTVGPAAENRYDTVMFITDRHVSDALRLRNTGPFRTYLEGRIEPMSECFSEPARRGAVECVPVRHPINLRVTHANEVSPQTGARAADRLPPPARAIDNEDRIPGSPVGTMRQPNEQPEQPQF